MNPADLPAVAHGEHDHTDCVAAALAAAERICSERGARLTPLRRRVLELVWASHRPAGAYEILAELRHQGRSAPPTVYRALDFLQQHGLVHRLASLNAYIGCPQPGREHTGQFFLCEGCRTLIEVDDPRVERAVQESARAVGFRVRHQAVEILGLCPNCRRGGVDSAT